ncbi:galactoside alpha-(1,2)-fucosyltransferase 2-like [Hyperolius riggenbachi]|uniref:galactoside alpha-(1,2)-fucosyltransferase 2-like n=1 Tax=Hyperolius riggenbachi TaxID=752182 RepID=UPI0035A2B84E
MVQVLCSCSACLEDTSQRTKSQEMMKKPIAEAGTPGKLNKRVLWVMATAFFLVLITFSYDYHYNLHISEFTGLVKNGKLLKSTEDLCPPVKKPKPLTGMWTINAAGRLGNYMGEYATLYALAKMHGRQAYILSSMHDQLSKMFKIRLPVLHEEISSKIKWNRLALHDWMSEEYYNIQRDHIYFIGTPCSYTIYHHIKDEILREFTFHDFIREESYAYLDKVRGDKKNVTFVGVHVRRGDYVSVMPNLWKGVVADKGYLQKATDYFRNKYENPLFIVTSNGMDWCKENINNSRGDIHFAGDGQEGSPARDFALLAHCNHTIMTIGTFGVWAGYLAGGETIYLTNYTLPDSPFLTFFKYEATFLPEWIGIPADLSPLLNKTNQNETITP